MGSSGRNRHPLLVMFWSPKLLTRTTQTLRCLLFIQMKLYIPTLNDFVAVFPNQVTQPGLLDALRGSEPLHLIQKMACLPQNPKVTSQVRAQADRILQMNSMHLVEEQNHVTHSSEEIYYDQYGWPHSALNLARLLTGLAPSQCMIHPFRSMNLNPKANWRSLSMYGRTAVRF